MPENINDPTLKAIVKWKNHLSIPGIASEHENRADFSFHFVSEEDVLAEIKALSRRPPRRMVFQLKSLRPMIISLQKRFSIISTYH